jgi:hypothetical protein
MLDHDEIERQGLQAMTKVLLPFLLFVGFGMGWREGACGWELLFQTGLVYLRLRLF